MGHFVGFPVTLGGFKVDGEDGLTGDSHQVSAFMLFFLAPGVELPAVGVIADWCDDLNELFNQFRSTVPEQDGHHAHRPSERENRRSLSCPKKPSGDRAQGRGLSVPAPSGRLRHLPVCKGLSILLMAVRHRRALQHGSACAF